MTTTAIITIPTTATRKVAVKSMLGDDADKLRILSPGQADTFEIHREVSLRIEEIPAE